MKRIRFKFSPEKAKAAIHWMVTQCSGVDIHTLLKACYFADKKHLNEFGRPIFGATYKAMKFGPVPLEVYEMAKSEAIWLAELSVDKMPWRIDGYKLVLEANDEPDMDVLSETDFDALKWAFETSSQMSFTSRTAATHGHDWRAAELGIMRYEDMIDDAENKKEIIGYLRESAPHIRL
ncbi:MAG: Panacea domain-containing protein [Rhodospirillales bacterium]